MSGRVNRGAAGASAAVLVAAALVLGAPRAAASTHPNVNSNATFRAAWTDAAATEIDLTANITLVCGSGTPTRNSSTAVVIKGNGHSIAYNTTPCAQDLLDQEGSGAITVDNASLTVNNGGATGDVIFDNSSGLITLTGVTLKSTSGGGTGDGVYDNTGPVTLSNSTFTMSNSGTADGVFSGSGPVTLTNSSIGGTLGGDGIFTSGVVTLTRSTVAGAGQGISAETSVSLTNSTVANNGAEGGVFTPGEATLVYSDIVNNGAVGAGRNINAEGITAFGSVIAKGPGGNCSTAGTTTHGYNYADDTSCHFTGTGDSQSTTNHPLLGTLANNGGATPTLLPLTGSPLINAIPSASCHADGASGITTDQRGFARPDASSPSCEIGSVEIQPASSPTPTPPTPSTGAATGTAGLGLGLLIVAAVLGLVVALTGRRRPARS